MAAAKTISRGKAASFDQWACGPAFMVLPAILLPRTTCQESIKSQIGEASTSPATTTRVRNRIRMK